jgi:hypothetical protein
MIVDSLGRSSMYHGFDEGITNALVYLVENDI